MFTSALKVTHPHHEQICVVSFYLPLRSLGPAFSSTKKKKKKKNGAMDLVCSFQCQKVKEEWG